MATCSFRMLLNIVFIELYGERPHHSCMHLFICGEHGWPCTGKDIQLWLQKCKLKFAAFELSKIIQVMNTSKQNMVNMYDTI